MFSPCVQEMRLLQAYEDSRPLRSALTPSYRSCWWSGWRTYLGVKSAEDLSAAAAVKLGWTEALLLFLQIKSRRGDGEWPGIWPVGWAFELLPAGILKKKRWDWRIEFPQWDQGEFIMSAFFCGLETIDMWSTRTQSEVNLMLATWWLQPRFSIGMRIQLRHLWAFFNFVVFLQSGLI